MDDQVGALREHVSHCISQYQAEVPLTCTRVHTPGQQSSVAQLMSV